MHSVMQEKGDCILIYRYKYDTIKGGWRERGREGGRRKKREYLGRWGGSREGRGGRGSISGDGEEVEGEGEEGEFSGEWGREMGRK